jgi:hypothetical protein
MMDIAWPSVEHLASYVDALRRGWSADTQRPEAAADELARIEADPPRLKSGVLHAVALFTALDPNIDDMEPGEDVPRNERKAQLVLGSLSLAAIALSVGGLAFDLYALATHHLTAVHTVSNVVALIPFAFGARTGVKYFGEARSRLKALRSGAQSPPTLGAATQRDPPPSRNL